MSFADEFIALSAQISELRLQQKNLVESYKGPSRALGTVKDVRLSYGMRKRLSTTALRLFVTQETIDRCTSESWARTIRIVPKLTSRRGKGE